MKISFKIHFTGKLLISMICLSLLSSCASIPSNKGSSVIDIASSVNKGAIYKASDFIKSIRYVPLEMTEASALGYIENLVVAQELYSWHDAADLLLLVEEGKMDKNLVKNLKEDDNPVVLIAVPK